MGNYLESVGKQFIYYKSLAEGAMRQLSAEQLNWQFNSESNSISIIVRHISGNMRSRFTEFLTTDGEKLWRNRDEEFMEHYVLPDQIFAIWEEGWAVLLETLGSLCDGDLGRIVYIRNEGHTVTEALNRQLAHYSYHAGQIVFIAKMCKDNEWRTLSIARNRSSYYNELKFSNEKQRKHYTDGL